MKTVSVMDAEITALEGTQSKARDVKQGMMSVMQTPPSAAGQAGKVRLVCVSVRGLIIPG